MTIYTLEIPNDDAAVPRWLEEQLANPDLRHFVAELRAVASPNHAPALKDILGPSRRFDVGAGAQHSQSRTTCGALLAHPELFYELQELVYSSGGDYWLKLLTRDSDRRAAQAQWPQIQQAIEPTATPAAADAEPPQYHRGDHVTRRGAPDRLLCDEIAIGSGTYGWNKPGVFDVALAKPAYLNHLADRAHEWFDKQPTNAEQLATRMKEFRESCDKLIAAKHPQLPEADRDWLREKCGLWAGKIDASLAKLDADPSQLKAVNAEMDETVNKLMTALRAVA